MALDPSKVAELESFVRLVQQNPSLIHTPELTFFKSYLTSMDATLPPNSKPTASGTGTAGTGTSSPAQFPETSSSSSSEDDDEIPFPEFEPDSDIIAPETVDFPEEGCSKEVEFSDEMFEKAGSLKTAAVEAMEANDYETALVKYSEVMKMGNSTALLFTRRATVLLKLNRPMACIRDCTAALELNPDNGKAYKTRGIAYRNLGKWEEAHKDLDCGQKIDYDEDTYEIQKVVAEKWKKIDEYQQAKRRHCERRERRKKEKEVKRRKAEAQRQYEKAETDGGFTGEGGHFPPGYPGGMPGGMGGMPGGMGGMPGGMGGMPGGMGGMPGGMGGMPGGMGGMPGGMGGMPGGMGGMGDMLGGLMSDPEMKKIFENPKMMSAMQDIMSNPANMAKYKDDPEVSAAFKKLTSKFGGGGMGGM